MFASRPPYFVASALFTALACGGSARDEHSEPFPSSGAGGDALASGGGRGSTGAGGTGDIGMGAGGVSGAAAAGNAGSAGSGGTDGIGILASELCSGSPSANACVGPYPPEPQALFEVETLGAGSLFVALRENAALARAPDGWHVVSAHLPADGLQIRVSDLVVPAGSPLPEFVDFSWAPFPEQMLYEFLGLVCDTPGCRLLGAGFSPGGYQLAETGMILEPSWQARGVFQPLPYEASSPEICVYGSGIHCHVQGVWREALSASLSGTIIDARDGRALTQDGRLFTARAAALPSGEVRTDWVASEFSVRFSRLTARGAIADGGLWLTSLGIPSLCQNSPGFIGGDGLRDALDQNGIVYYQQQRGGSQVCRWSQTIPDVLGESYLTCGIMQNWLALTPGRLLALSGPLFCALD